MSDPNQQAKKFQKELSAGIYSLVLLNVLSESAEAMYGYQIAKYLEDNGPNELKMKQGTLYPVLRSLEENGLLSSMVEPSVSGPPRKYYSITPQGKDALKEWIEIWNQTKNFVDAVLKDNIMFKTIEEYLKALKNEMQESDPALLQDALSDAREHLSAALSQAREENSAIDDSDALQSIIDNYGTPGETASAYREVERRTGPSLNQHKKTGSALGKFLGVYIDPRTWGSLLFMFISLITGIIYFTWAVSGTALSISLLILIIGIPFALLFLLSLQGLALFEGRIVEALLGERMPRRPAFAQPGLKWIERLKALVTDWHTWRALVYMILQLPLGVIYFSVNISLLAFELGIMLAPVGELFFKLNPGNHFDIQLGGLPHWILWFLPVVGFILLTINLHLVRALGWLHGRYAKWLLVS